MMGLDAMIGGTLNYMGAHRANEANREMAHEQMEFQRQSNKEQMQFQERMSNTAYQRSMQDMRQAGLNPILAYNQGGASTPSGSSSGGAMATMQNEFSGAVASALDARRAVAEVKNLQSQNKNLDAMNSQIRSQTRLNNANSAIAKVSAEAASTKLPGLHTEQKIDETQFGQFLQYLNRLNPFRNMFRK